MAHLARAQASLLPSNLLPAEHQFFTILLGNAVTAQNLLTSALQRQIDAEAGVPDANGNPIAPLSPDALAKITRSAFGTVKEMYEILDLKARLKDREGTKGKRIVARVGIRHSDGTEAVAEVHAER